MSKNHFPGQVQLTTAFPSTAPPPAKPQTWQWADLGSPTTTQLLPVGVAQPQGVTTVLVAAQNTPMDPYDFYGATPGATPQQWQWAKLVSGKSLITYLPLGVLQIGAVSNVFLQGSDGGFYCLQSGGSSWQWASLPQPGKTLMQSAGTLVSGTNSIAYFTSTDNCLCLLLCDNQGNWSWNNSTPPKGNLSIALGTGLVNGTPTTYIIDDSGTLYQCQHTPGTIFWSWSNQPHPQLPAGVTITAAAGTVVAGTTLNFLALGSDHQLWSLWLSSNPVQGLQWAPLAPPSGVAFTAPMGTLTAGTSVNVLLLGSDNNLWSYWYKQFTGWCLAPLQKPAGQLGLPVGTRQAGSAPGVFLVSHVGNQVYGCQYCSN